MGNHFIIEYCPEEKKFYCDTNSRIHNREEEKHYFNSFRKN